MVIEERHTFVKINIPFLYAPDSLFCWKNRIRRALLAANLATNAKTVRAEVIFFVRLYHGDIGENIGESQVRTQLTVDN